MATAPATREKSTVLLPGNCRVLFLFRFVVNSCRYVRFVFYVFCFATLTVSRSGQVRAGSESDYPGGVEVVIV